MSLSPFSEKSITRSWNAVMNTLSRRRPSTVRNRSIILSVIAISVGLSIDARRLISSSIAPCTASALSPGIDDVAATAFINASLSVSRRIRGVPSSLNTGSPLSLHSGTISKRHSSNL